MKKLRRQMVSGVLVLSLLATMLPMSALAAEDIELPVEAESLVLDESLQQDSIEEKIRSGVEPETDSPHIFSDTVVKYQVEGGYLYFDTATGTITDCDEDVTSADIPTEIEGVLVTSIGERAFYDCDSLTSVTIGNGVKSIGEYAFFLCESLTSVTIGNSVTSIEDYAFFGCDSLTSIDIPDNVTTIGFGAFYECERLANVTIGNNVTSIEDYAFYGCDSLTSVDMPNSVTTIGEWAFCGCESLTSVIIPDSLTSIGEWAFYRCYELTNVYYSGSEEKWDAIEIGFENQYLLRAAIHYNSTGPGDVGTQSSYMIDIFTEYNAETKQAVFGINPDVYTYKVTDETDMSFVDQLDELLGQRVLVHYISGEYGESDQLVRYILSITPANVKTGTVESITESTITIDGQTYNQNLNGFIGLDSYIGQNVVCYFNNDIVVDMKLLEKKTDILSAGSNNTVTIDDIQYIAIFDGIPPYLSAPDLWFGHNVNYWISSDIVYQIELPDYQTNYKKKLIGYDSNTQIATFHDGSIFYVSSNIKDNVSSLINHWVTITVTTSATRGGELTEISLIKPELGLKIEMVNTNDIYLKNNKYSYDGTTYENSSAFEIKFEITVSNSISGVTESDLEQMKDDSSLDITLDELKAIAPDGFNFGWTGSGNIEDFSSKVIHVGEIYTVTGFVRPDMLFFVDTEDVVKSIECSANTTNGDSKIASTSFKIINLDYEEPDQGNSDEELDQIIEDGIKDFEENDISSQIYLDINPMKNVFGISGKALDTLEREILTAVIMSNAPENTKVEEFQDELMETVFGKYKTDVTASSYIVPLYYVIKTEKYGELTVRFDCKVTSCAVTDSRVAIYATIGYEIIGQSSKAMLKVPSYLKTNSALGQIAVTDGKSFCDAVYKVAEDAIKDMYNDVWGNTANEAADILFDECIKKILEAFDTSVSDIMWEIMTWPAKNITNACPTDVYIYDKNNVLCGSIINNIITLESNNFELSVEGDTKYIKGLTDDYTVKYVATDNGYMNVEIIEMMGYNKALRTVKFEDVKLIKEVEFTQDISVTSLEDTQSYNLESTTGEIVKADKDDILINFTPDDSETVSVTSIAINKQTTKLSQIGATEQLIATITPADASNKSVTWVSSNPNIATVDNTGLVTALANGTTTITVKTVDGGYTANCTVTVDIKSTSNNGGGNGSSSNSSGGGSVTPTSYSISISDTDGGTITISPKTANKDKIVTITAVPDEGYKLDTLSVSDKNGNQIEFTKKTDTEYTFKMPASKVTVNATFSKVIAAPKPSSMLLTDVSENAWYYNAVKYVYENGMMQGISDIEFAPTEAMNRAMIVTVLHRLENTPETTSTNQFADVESNQWYTDSVQWAFENDIVNGYSSDRFVPMDNVTREQLAVILYNYTNYKGGNTDIVGDLTAFQDADNTSNWAKNAISWAVSAGLLSGKGDGILDPKGTATRAEVAQILMNYCIKVI